MKIGKAAVNGIIASLILSFGMLAGPAFAELRTTTAPDALCSNGEQATYAYFDDGKSNDWLVYIHGGGVAANADQYRGRPEGMKRPAPNDYIGVRLTNDFRDQGFNVIIIGYCTSDLYQGFHTHNIDGKTVYFHGRKIVENVIAAVEQVAPRVNGWRNVLALHLKATNTVALPFYHSLPHAG